METTWHTDADDVTTCSSCSRVFKIGRGETCACPVGGPPGTLGRQSHENESGSHDSGTGGPLDWAADEWRADLQALKVDGLAHRAKVVIEEFNLVEQLWREDKFKSAEGYVAARAALHKLVAWMRESDRKTVSGGYAAARDREAIQEAETNTKTAAQLKKIREGRH